MYKGKTHIGIRLFFLALFLSYFTDITFFSHTHIIHGITIVHSHYTFGTSSSQKEKATHSHSEKALTLIAHASSWTSLTEAVPAIPASFPVGYTLSGADKAPATIQAVVPSFHLRGPPAICSID